MIAVTFTPKEILDCATSLLHVSVRFMSADQEEDSEAYMELGLRLFGNIQSQETHAAIFTETEILHCAGSLMSLSVFFQSHNDEEESEAFFNLSMKLFGHLTTQDALVAEEDVA